MRYAGGKAVSARFNLAILLAVTPALEAVAAETAYTATTTLFADVTQTERGAESDTRGGAGISGDLGAQLMTGPHSLNARYGATLETKRSSLANGDNDDLSLRGASSYQFYEPQGRFDFNLGHTIRTVRNETGFTLDASDYGTQNSVSAGAGVNFNPGDLTTLRVGGQAGKNWHEGDLEDGETASVDAQLTRRLSDLSSGSLTGRRSWESSEGADITLDSVSLGFSTEFENGGLQASVGVSRADSDAFDNEAVIGSLARNWSSEWSDTRLSYDRTQSSTLLDLAIAPIPELGIEEEFSIRVQGLTERDSVALVHSTRRVCSLCTVNFVFRGTREEQVASGDENWEYLAGTGLSLAVSDHKTLDFDYRWQGEAFGDSSPIADEIHRLFVTYRHQLTEQATWGATIDSALTRGEADQEQYRARVFITLGWDGMERQW